jgi:hypothetical protein
MHEFRLKALPREAIPRAMKKVEQYRLLNEPREAESICLDVLAAEPDHQEALVQLVLSLTDQFCLGGLGECERRARELVPRLEGEYLKAYYCGIISERRAKAQLDMGVVGYVVYDGLREAMDFYDKAAAIQPEDGEDALLRWNTCARLIMNTASVEPRDEEDGYEPYLE